MLLVFTELLPEELSSSLDGIGVLWKQVGSTSEIEGLSPQGGWSGTFVIDTDLSAALITCASLRQQEISVGPILIGIPESELANLTRSNRLFDDFIALPARNNELAARLRAMSSRFIPDAKPQIVEYNGLVLNLATYQTSVSGRPLDMTYMEYQLLKHFMTNPGSVLSREVLLKDVWGYEYYGGARTVDVHVRRLRAKLGEEHSQLIHTVRSVGYVFSPTQWDL